MQRRYAIAGSENGNKADSLLKRAYDVIKGKILAGDYKPGAFLQEGAICNDVKLGRTPVHQALHKLMEEGLVDVIPRKGIIVSSDSLSDIKSTLELRLVLETYCAEQAAKRMNPLDRKRLRSAAQMAPGRVGLQSRANFVSADLEFHSLIANATGNRMMADVVRSLHEKMTRIWLLSTIAPENWNPLDNHYAIYKAIAKQDPRSAAKAMRDHLESLQELLLARR